MTEYLPKTSGVTPVFLQDTYYTSTIGRQQPRYGAHTMAEHHKDASVGVAQAILAGMPAAEQATVQDEADKLGVSAVEIVRRSLDILIAESGPGVSPGTIGRPSGT